MQNSNPLFSNSDNYLEMLGDTWNNHFNHADDHFKSHKDYHSDWFAEFIYKVALEKQRYSANIELAHHKAKLNYKFCGFGHCRYLSKWIWDSI